MTDATTWDGLPIAADRPRGVGVVVRRGARDGRSEHLMLHRHHNGPDFEGDWAWTSPGGARQPGEAVYAAALRELAEESGIAGVLPWAVDLSGDAAIFALDVADGTEVELVDPEHDRFVWVSPTDAAAMALPVFVGAQHAKVAGIAPAEISFVPMVADDLADVVDWQHAPHAAEWFVGGPADLAAAIAYYGKRFEKDARTKMWVVEVDGRRIGYVQAYRVSDYDDYAFKTKDPEAVAFDYVIGEPDAVGRGVGTAMIWSLLRDLLCPAYPDAPRFLASPDHRNGRSIRVLEKCGFTQGLWIDIPAQPDQPAATEIVCTLDRHHWLGP